MPSRRPCAASTAGRATTCAAARADKFLAIGRADRDGESPQSRSLVKISARAWNFLARSGAACGNEALSLEPYACSGGESHRGARALDIGDMRARRAFRVLPRWRDASVGAASLAGCDEDLGSASNYRAYSPIPEATLASIDAKGSTKNAPVLIRAFKKEAETGDLEAARRRPLRLPEDLPDVPLVGPARPQGPRRRPAGAGRLLHDHPGVHEPELGLLPVASTSAIPTPMTAPGATPAAPSWCTASAPRPAASR